MKILKYASLIVFISLIALIYYDINNSECYKLPENDAKKMINAILESKKQRSKNGTILFGYKYNEISYSGYSIYSGEKGDGLNSVDLTYNNKNTNKPLFKVSIFENCGLHWYDRSSKNDISN